MEFSERLEELVLAQKECIRGDGGGDLMRRELITILLCTSCGEGSLTLAWIGEEGTEIREGVIACETCGREYAIREGVLDLLVNPSPDVEREIEAWSSFCEDRNFSEEDREGAREWLLGLPMLEGKKGPRAELDTWRRHGRAVFGLCAGMDWEGRRVLELGAGRCWLSAHLARRGARVVAVDILEADELGLGCAEAFLGEGVLFDRVLCDMHHLPFRTGSFDAVVATATLHHSPNPVALLEEVRRVTRPDGLLVAANEPLYVPYRVTPEEEKRGACEGAYTLAAWMRFLRQAGWREEHLEVGMEAALHFKAMPAGCGGSLPLPQRVAANARYAAILALALPRRTLRMVRDLKAGRPMRPLPADKMGYLRARMGLSRINTTALAADEANWGPGWYPPERGDEPFRWSGPRSRFLLPPRGGKGILALELATFRPSPQTDPVVIDVSVAGQKAGTIRIDRHGWKIYSLESPPVFGVRPVSITLRVKSGYFIPGDMGLGNDLRLLGVACRGARWEN